MCILIIFKRFITRLPINLPLIWIRAPNLNLNKFLAGTLYLPREGDNAFYKKDNLKDNTANMLNKKISSIKNC